MNAVIGGLYRKTGRARRNSNGVPAGANTDLLWPMSPVAVPIAAPAAGTPSAVPIAVPGTPIETVGERSHRSPCFDHFPLGSRRFNGWVFPEHDTDCLIGREINSAAAACQTSRLAAATENAIRVLSPAFLSKGLGNREHFIARAKEFYRVPKWTTSALGTLPDIDLRKLIQSGILPAQQVVTETPLITRQVRFS
jgi:hypothetical protein